MGLTILGGLVTLLSSLYAILGTIDGTCTMYSADELELGGFAAAAGYTIGIPLLITRPPTMRGWAFLAPVIAAVLYQAYLAGSFFIAYHLHALSACAWKMGNPEYLDDGREPWLTWLWVGVSAFGLVGIAGAWVRGRRLQRIVPPSNGETR